MRKTKDEQRAEIYKDIARLKMMYKHFAEQNAGIKARLKELRKQLKTINQ